LYYYINIQTSTHTHTHTHTHIYTIMSSRFLHIVKASGKLHKLGCEIIQHKKNVKHMTDNHIIERAFADQEKRIQMFVNEINKQNENWKKSQHSIDEYWTGLS